jgi:hypothetical protein
MLVCSAHRSLARVILCLSILREAKEPRVAWKLLLAVENP